MAPCCLAFLGGCVADKQPKGQGGKFDGGGRWSRMPSIKEKGEEDSDGVVFAHGAAKGSPSLQQFCCSLEAGKALQLSGANLEELLKYAAGKERVSLEAHDAAWKEVARLQRELADSAQRLAQRDADANELQRQMKEREAQWNAQVICKEKEVCHLQEQLAEEMARRAGLQQELFNERHMRTQEWAALERESSLRRSCSQSPELQRPQLFRRECTFAPDAGFMRGSSPSPELQRPQLLRRERTFASGAGFPREGNFGQELAPTLRRDPSAPGFGGGFAREGSFGHEPATMMQRDPSAPEVGLSAPVVQLVSARSRIRSGPRRSLQVTVQSRSGAASPGLPRTPKSSTATGASSGALSVSTSTPTISRRPSLCALSTPTATPTSSRRNSATMIIGPHAHRELPPTAPVVVPAAGRSVAAASTTGWYEKLPRTSIGITSAEQEGAGAGRAEYPPL